MTDLSREERLATVPSSLANLIAQDQAAAVAKVEFPHRDPAWVPSTGALSARLIGAPDHPCYDYLTDLTLEQKAALPARFHVPTFDDLGKPNAWLCEVCWDEGTVTAWPCATARKHGAEVFGQSREDVHRARLESVLAEAVWPTRAVPPMTDQIREERLAEITARDAAAYPGPWSWRGNTKMRDLRLESPHGDSMTIMDFARYGMRDGKPRFAIDGLMHDADELVEYEVHAWTDRTRPPYRYDVSGINHPDAEFIAKAREDIPFLLAEVAELRAERDRARSIAVRLEQEIADLEAGPGINEAA